MSYIRLSFIQKQGSVLLEIKLPREINKSPLAMEIFFTALYQTGAASYIETYINGKVRPWFSLELVSIGGVIHFYIWTQPKFRNLIESQLYAQYPNIEIHEAEDYTKNVVHHPNPPNGGGSFWATYYKLIDKDIYPIKTYVDYGMDKDPKEEYKIDPFAAVLEYLGSIREGQQVWIQILIQAHKKESLKDGRLFSRPDWKDDARKEIKKIRDDSTVKVDDRPSFPHPTKGQTDKIGAIERSLQKWPFETMMRGFYIWEDGKFDSGNITGLIGSTRQYSSNDLNGFKLGWFTDFDYPWQDFRRIRRNAAERKMLKAYKLRSYFQPPFKNHHGKPFILTTEELATIFHFPGEVVQTPTLPRIPSKRAVPPSNLPI